MALRRCARLAGVFPIRLEREKPPKEGEAAYTQDSGKQRLEQMLYNKKGEGEQDGVRRGAKLTTKSRDGKVEMGTYITNDGGRIDYLDIKWPPAHLDVRSVPVEEVRVKFGTPWPSLYPALDVFNAEVNLRYVIDSSFPALAALAAHGGDRCGACVSEKDALFKPLQLDEEVRAHIRRCVYSPVAKWRYWLYSRLVDLGTYRYSAASMLSISHLYLFSTEQVKDLMSDRADPVESVLDIGAGSGDITAVFQDVLKDASFTATEVAQPLKRDLEKKGVAAFVIDRPQPQWMGGREEGFDLVLLLNVLDRCASLTRLLDDAVARTNPGGRLIVSLPLPMRQAQHRLGAAQELLWPPPFNKPCAWEHAAAWFANLILDRYGGVLKLTRLVRAPYISNGPASAPISVLDAGVFVLDKTKSPYHEASLKGDWGDASVPYEPLIV
eukprot:TRINITY_DN24895_c0_g1_i1.p1 TRINITY_DN24895_c0_g1~~TRINITY_DN24895_c0_g1_i1.p1  ORF type:complete len:460 (+),score=177.37 TRINITY_DN24895_c0_g1_i1:66-1382(+)